MLGKIIFDVNVPLKNPFGENHHTHYKAHVPKSLWLIVESYIFLGFGGQIALNTGLLFHKLSILSKYGEPCMHISAIIVEEAIKAANEVKYPVIVCAAIVLGGLGSS